jgi:protein-disulfide isomerase
MPEDDGPATFTITRNQGIAIALLFGIMIGFSGATLGGANPVDTVGNFFGEDTSDDGDDVQRQVEVSKIDTEGEPVLGQEDAPVTMVVYEDFQCPYCQRFESNAMKDIESNYVETGDVKVIWKDFPLGNHPWAAPAAETMECVYRQDNDAFWSIKDTIFNNQDVLSPQNVQDEIIAWASAEGVSEDAVRTCLDEENPGEEVNGDLQEGQSFDAMVAVAGEDRPFVSGTPASVIYAEGDEMGEPVVGAQPYQAFKNVIESKMQG